MKNKLLLIAALALLPTARSFAQSSYTTYTITPFQTASVNVSVAITDSKGRTTDYPTNYMYPQFSPDSISVQWYNASSGNNITFKPDSINHYWTGGHNFGIKDVKGVDSLFHLRMVK